MEKMNLLSLYDIGMRTWPKVQFDGASVYDWLSYLNLNRDDVRVIVKAGQLEGMVIASVSGDTLYVKELVGLVDGVFGEFVSRAREIWGNEFHFVQYNRRGRKVKTISYDKLLQLKHI